MEFSRYEPGVRKTIKRTGLGRDGEKHVELCLDASQSFQNLASFFVDMHFRANVTKPPVLIILNQKTLQQIETQFLFFLFITGIQKVKNIIIVTRAYNQETLYRVFQSKFLEFSGYGDNDKRR